MFIEICKLSVLLFLLTYTPVSLADDLYELLGVPRDATVKEIRKAFKLLAVKLHPDKNQGDEEAETKFVEITKAYEVLKDPDSRKQYDLHGDTGTKTKQQYHSYSYYTNQFGIYDDDPLIITLSSADYEVNVLDNDQAWFVNFYSPHCHHCHELAPAWRKLAEDLEGVIRIAAVNCEDDWSLCYQLSIGSYPTLLYYEKEANLHEGERYTGSRTFESFKDFVLSKLVVNIPEITSKQWGQGLKERQWLLFLCPQDNSNCPDDDARLKLAAILDGLLSVGTVTDSDLCHQIYESYEQNPVILWQINDDTQSGLNVVVHNVAGSDSKDILNQVFNVLPDPVTINEDDFQNIRHKLRLGTDQPWLFCFYMGIATDLNLQIKRLPSLLPTLNIGLVHCGKSAALCSSLHIARYPTWGVLKPGGAFEKHHGRDVLYEVVSFAKEGMKSTNLHALSPADFYNIVSEERDMHIILIRNKTETPGSTWFIDWYAPWCPPCRKLMPELRRASQHFDSNKIQFGTVDCTLHRNLCSQQGITSYPTTLLYNGSEIHKFSGIPSADGIVEFVSDMLTPNVINLDENSFLQLMRKPDSEIWFVDFFAPWCGPCQRLGPEWRKLAKQMVEFPEVKIAQVDCTTNYDLCQAQNVKSYPTLRLYPLGGRGLNKVAMYSGNRDLLSLKRWLLGFIPSPVVQMTAENFNEQILTKKFMVPWLVDFYVPWCHGCIEFEPDFRKVAQRLEGQVRTAKVDCEAERLLCAKLYVMQYPTVFLYLSPTQRHDILSQNAAKIIEQVKSIISSERNHNHDEL